VPFNFAVAVPFNFAIAVPFSFVTWLSKLPIPRKT
jgi:hypothetical protein